MQVLNSFTTTVEKALGELYPGWRDVPGLVVCGSHLPYEQEAIIEAIEYARVNKLPFLGICAGHQLAALEYARNVRGIKDATSEEYSQTGTFIITKRPELKVGMHNGETWWSNYEVTTEFQNLWRKEPNFITVPYHPEYQSSRSEPHPVLIAFIDAAKQYAAEI